MVSQLSEYDLSTLYQLMKPITWTKKKKDGLNNRLGFPDHRSTVFGIVRPRKNSGILTLSNDSKKYPHILEALDKIGTELNCVYNAIQVNRNCQCPPHFDKKNVGDSMLISFGDYENGEIVIDGVKYNAYHRPTIFNGSQLEHYNEPHTGDKFSIIYFLMK
jgi:hypothetical protein